MRAVEISPVKALDAVIGCPKSKGYTNRALVAAALAKGTSRLTNVLISDDTMHMVRGLKAFGAKISLSESTAVVEGVNGKPATPKNVIYAGNSGTTARFLTAVASLDGTATVDGDSRMRDRPINDLADALSLLGASVSTRNGFPPVAVTGATLKGGKIRMSGKTSSQFISAVLMVAPYAIKDMVINVTGELTSKPFVDMTVGVINDFGGKAKNDKYNKFTVTAGKTYAGRDYFIEGDAANASYFFAAAAITGGKVRVTGINPESRQGEIAFPDVLRRMGCSVKAGEDWIEVKGVTKLKGIDIDMNSMPDAVQTLAVVAAFASSPSIIRNVANLRLKETDRLAAMAAELRKLGVHVEELGDGLKITPDKGKLKGADISTYNDHRMAMSFAIAGLRVRGIRIKNPECVRKTFPDFFRQLKRLVQ